MRPRQPFTEHLQRPVGARHVGKAALPLELPLGQPVDLIHHVAPLQERLVVSPLDPLNELYELEDGRELLGYEFAASGIRTLRCDHRIVHQRFELPGIEHIGGASRPVGHLRRKLHIAPGDILLTILDRPRAPGHAHHIIERGLGQKPRQLLAICFLSKARHAASSILSSTARIGRSGTLVLPPRTATLPWKLC